MSGGLAIPLIDFSPLAKLGETFAQAGQREEAQRLLSQQLDAAVAAQGQQSGVLSPLGTPVTPQGVPAVPNAASGRLPSFAGGSAAMTVPNMGSDNEKKFVGALQAGGLTNPYGLAAVAAYANRESGYKGSNITGAWSDPSESGAPGQSGGILSWRGDRLANMRRFTAGAPDPVTAQAQFTLFENPALTQALQNAKSPEEANSLMANAWRFAGFNRPGGENAARLNATRSYLARLNGGGFGDAGAVAPPTMVAAASGPGAFVSGTNPARAPMRLPASAGGAMPVQAASVAAPVAAADMPAPGAQPTAGFAVPGSGQVVQAGGGGEFTPGALASPPVGQPSAAASAPGLAPAAAQRITPAQAQNLRAMLANPLTHGYAAKIIEGLNKPAEFSFQVVGDQLIRTSKDGRAEVVPNINKPPTFSVTKGSDGNDYVFNPQTGALTSAIKGRDTTYRSLTDPGERASYGVPSSYTGPVQVDADNKLIAPFKPSTEVNVNNAAEKVQDQTIGKAYGETFNELQASARSAQGQLNTLRLMERLIESPDFYSGTGSTAFLAAKRAAASLGLKDAETAAAPNELFSKLATQSLLDKAGGNLGAGISNSDVLTLNRTIANPENTPEGNRQIIQFGKALAQRQLEVAKMSRDYARAHGWRLDPGFDDQLAQWAEANPLNLELTPLQKKAMTAGSSGASTGGQPVRIPANMTPEQVRSQYPKGTPIILPDGRQGVVP